MLFSLWLPLKTFACVFFSMFRDWISFSGSVASLGVSPIWRGCIAWDSELFQRACFFNLSSQSSSEYAGEVMQWRFVAESAKSCIVWYYRCHVREWQTGGSCTRFQGSIDSPCQNVKQVTILFSRYTPKRPKIHLCQMFASRAR